MNHPPARVERRALDGKTVAATGMLLAVLGVSNLAQGAWLPFLPWLNLTLLAPPALALLAVADSPRSRRGRPTGLLLLIVSFLPGFFSAVLNPGAAEKRVTIALAVLLVLVISYSTARSPRILHGFAIGLVILGGIVLAAQWLNPDPAVLALGRRTPDGLNSIGTGRVLGLAALACLVSAIGSVRRPVPRLWWSGMAVLFVAGAGAAASRGPLVGLVVGAVVVLLASVQLTRPVRLTLVLIALVSIGLAIRDLQAEGSRLVSTEDSGRTHLLLATWEVAKDNPAGIGWGNLYNYLPAHIVSGVQGYNQYPHNVILEMLVTGGWLSLGLFLTGLTIAGRAAFRCSSLHRGSLIWGAFVFALIGALFSSDAVGNRLLWVISAMALSIWGRHQVESAQGSELNIP